jgi:hypothetical protein
VGDSKSSDLFYSVFDFIGTLILHEAKEAIPHNGLITHDAALWVLLCPSLFR